MISAIARNAHTPFWLPHFGAKGPLQRRLPLNALASDQRQSITSEKTTTTDNS
jgi:hypothetical protein